MIVQTTMESLFGPIADNSLASTGTSIFTDSLTDKSLQSCDLESWSGTNSCDFSSDSADINLEEMSHTLDNMQDELDAYLHDAQHGQAQPAQVGHTESNFPTSLVSGENTHKSFGSSTCLSSPYPVFDVGEGTDLFESQHMNLLSPEHVSPQRKRSRKQKHKPLRDDEVDFIEMKIPLSPYLEENEMPLDKNTAPGETGRRRKNKASRQLTFELDDDYLLSVENMRAVEVLENIMNSDDPDIKTVLDSRDDPDMLQPCDDALSSLDGDIWPQRVEFEEAGNATDCTYLNACSSLTINTLIW